MCAANACNREKESEKNAFFLHLANMDDGGVVCRGLCDVVAAAYFFQCMIYAKT